MRNSLLRILSVVFALFLTLTSVYGSELVYLSLQREGQASIAIDEKKKAAYVIDLGRGGDGDKMTIDNVPILDKLTQVGTEDLYFVCSHPHSDHMGGIRKLFERPRVFFMDDELTKPRFKSITLIDDGVANNLFRILQQSLGGNTSIKIARRSATNKNAFEGISNASDDVHIETIPYSVIGKAGIHGRAVVTYIKLGQNVIVDFDDADTKAIAKIVEALKARGVTSITTFVVPHHGSKYHDIEPILTLNPRYAVLPVNPENRYGHPSPTIVLKLMQKLGKRNVVFTGSVENVVLDPAGIKYAMFTAAQKDSYALFVAPNRIRAERKGIRQDVQATIEIQKMMDDEGGGIIRQGDENSEDQRSRRNAGGSARTLIEQTLLANGSILSTDFEFGGISFGVDGPAAIRNRRVFAFPIGSTGSTGDMTGREIAVVVERDVNDSKEQKTTLTAAEARTVMQRLQIAGNNADKANAIYVYFSNPTGLRNVLEPAVVIPPSELVSLLAPRKPAPPRRQSRPGKPRPGSGLGLGNTPSGGSVTMQPTEPTKLPRGGMVFLQGGKLFPVGEANELLGSVLDICGEQRDKFCLKISGEGPASENTFQLPFSHGILFSEVWSRVYDRRIDSFYLSINPTKQFVQNIGRYLDQIPTERLQFGNDNAGNFRTHEVVTAGDIANSRIGKILWEADVAFKTESLGFDVLKGRHAFYQTQTRRNLAQPRSTASNTADDAETPYRDRWCRLYWTSGKQTLEVTASRKIVFKGKAVIARSEPMRAQNGTLVDVPSGGWCDDTKNVAGSLEAQANSGQAALDVLNQLRQLAEIQNFVLWARNNGITPTDEFRRYVQISNPTAAYEVPNWSSGVRTAPHVQVQQQRRLTGGAFFNLLHVNFVERSMIRKCVLPFWDAQNDEFPLAGLRYNTLQDRWDMPQGKYQFVDEWMSQLASKIVNCSGGNLLQPITLATYGDGVGERESSFGIDFHPQGIQMHGGVLLGIQKDFLTAATDKGLLLSPTRTPLFQRASEQLHFWNTVAGSSEDDPIAQHVVINDGVVTKAYWFQGHLVFNVEIKPGATLREEIRAPRNSDFTRGFEWMGTRHGYDGSWIWSKAAGLCAQENQSGPQCVRVSEMTADALRKTLGRQLPIAIHQYSEKMWFVALDMSKIRVGLDERWAKTSSSEVNQQLTLLYEYAKWGFIEEATTRYKQIVQRIERDTVDTLLIKELEGMSVKQ